MEKKLEDSLSFLNVNKYRKNKQKRSIKSRNWKTIRKWIKSGSQKRLFGFFSLLDTNTFDWKCSDRLINWIGTMYCWTETNSNVWYLYRCYLLSVTLAYALFCQKWTIEISDLEWKKLHPDSGCTLHKWFLFIQGVYLIILALSCVSKSRIISNNTHIKHQTLIVFKIV